MADYYSNADEGQRFVEGELARGSDVDSKFDDVEASFDLLPSEDELKLDMTAYAATGGVADAYTLTLPHTITEYTLGQKIVFKVSAANTGASTINVDSIGVVGLKRPDGSSLQAGDLLGDMIADARYDGTNFRLIGASYASSVSGIEIIWSVYAISGNCTTGAGHVVDNTASGITMTLPAAPTVGDAVYFAMTGGTNTWILGRNSLKIMGLEEDMTVTLYEGGFGLIYSGATNGWVLG